MSTHNIRFREEITNVPAHDKTCNKTSATSEDSDQPAHPRSLIRVSADRMWLLQPLGYLKRNKQEPLPYWVGIQAGLRHLSLCWSHRSYCRFCRALLKYIMKIPLLIWSYAGKDEAP